jgi:hypothetical protein
MKCQREHFIFLQMPRKFAIDSEGCHQLTNLDLILLQDLFYNYVPCCLELSRQCNIICEYVSFYLRSLYLNRG